MLLIRVGVPRREVRVPRKNKKKLSKYLTKGIQWLYICSGNKRREFKEVRETKEIKEVKEDKEIKEVKELKEIKDNHP